MPKTFVFQSALSFAPEHPLVFFLHSALSALP